MIIKTFPVGMLQENCYIIINEEINEAVTVDPGDEGERLIANIERLGCSLKAILLTHGHADHVGAVVDLKNKFNVPVYINEKEIICMQNDNTVFGKLPECYDFIKDGDELAIAGLKIKCIHTPGHTLGGMCFLIDNELFTGDTLFQGAVGRSDFYGGNHAELINSINEKLMILDKKINIYPGHGPSSTLMYEAMRNPFLQDDLF